MARASDELRSITIIPDWTKTPLGSALISCGNTRVLCTALIEDKVPAFREGRGGWMTAEYGMLPASSPYRIRRPIGKMDGRQTEIQRLIGRSLRAGFNLDLLGARTLWIDCDVLEADGGTRTAAITGAYVAARLAVERLIKEGAVSPEVMVTEITAVSVGLVDGKPWLDLDYPLDSRAEVDMNVVMDAEGRFIEVQGTGEKRGMTRQELDALLDLAEKGIHELREKQRLAVVQALES